jgi:hypothetical protein
VGELEEEGALNGLSSEDVTSNSSLALSHEDKSRTSSEQSEPQHGTEDSPKLLLSTGTYPPSIFAKHRSSGAVLPPTPHSPKKLNNGKNILCFSLFESYPYTLSAGKEVEYLSLETSTCTCRDKIRDIVCFAGEP